MNNRVKFSPVMELTFQCKKYKDTISFFKVFTIKGDMKLHIKKKKYNSNNDNNCNKGDKENVTRRVWKELTISKEPEFKSRF